MTSIRKVVVPGSRRADKANPTVLDLTPPAIILVLVDTVEVVHQVVHQFKAILGEEEDTRHRVLHQFKAILGEEEDMPHRVLLQFKAILGEEEGMPHQVLRQFKAILGEEGDIARPAPEAVVLSLV